LWLKAALAASVLDSLWLKAAQAAAGHGVQSAGAAGCCAVRGVGVGGGAQTGAEGLRSRQQRGMTFAALTAPLLCRRLRRGNPVAGVLLCMRKRWEIQGLHACVCVLLCMRKRWEIQGLHVRVCV